MYTPARVWYTVRVMIELFLALLAAHYVADFPFQSSTISKFKGVVFFEAIGFHCLTSHAIIHAGMAGLVAALLGFPWVWPFLAVGLSHWLIDFCKSWQGFEDFHLTEGAREGPQLFGLYGINVDQALHVGVLAAVALGLVLCWTCTRIL